MSVSMMLEESDASPVDRDFICSCILYGARKGHYSVDVNDRGIIMSMKKEVSTVIEHNRLLDNRFAKALVFKLGSERVATVILCEAAHGEGRFEIYAMSVSKKHQNKGFGSMILDAVLDRLLHVDVCARCLPVSRVMIQLLSRRGFMLHAIENGFSLMVRNAIFEAGLIDLPGERPLVR